MARGDTRKAILDIAEELLQHRGYNGFSYQHISDALGIKKAAIHYHFASKTDLGVALITRFRERFLELISHLPDDSLICLNTYIEVAVEYLQEGSKACPGGVLGAEFQAIPAEMQIEARAMMREANDWLAGVLERGRTAGDFSFVGEASDKALMLSASLQGALQIARVTEADRFHRIVNQMKAELLAQSAVTLASNYQ